MTEEIKGAATIYPEAKKDAKKPRPGMARVTFTQHYDRYQVGDRAIVSIEEFDIEMKKSPDDQRFELVKMGDTVAKSRSGHIVGNRKVRV